MNSKLKPVRIDPSFFTKRDDTLVTWLGMAGAAINSRGTILFIDPLISVVRQNGEEIVDSGHRLIIHLPLEAKDVPKADAVLYTHADADHFGRATAQEFSARLKPTFIALPPVISLIGELGVDQEHMITATDFQHIQVGNVEVVVTPTLHNFKRDPEPWKRGDCSGFLVKTPDGTIWHPGDTRLIDDLLAIRGVDVLFFDVAPVEAHLGSEGSARLAQTCGAKVMVAYHYGTFDLPSGTWGSCDPEGALPYVKGLSAQFLLLSPGELLRLPLLQWRRT